MVREGRIPVRSSTPEVWKGGALNTACTASSISIANPFSLHSIIHFHYILIAHLSGSPLQTLISFSLPMSNNMAHWEHQSLKWTQQQQNHVPSITGSDFENSAKSELAHLWALVAFFLSSLFQRHIFDMNYKLKWCEKCNGWIMNIVCTHEKLHWKHFCQVPLPHGWRELFHLQAWHPSKWFFVSRSLVFCLVPALVCTHWEHHSPC